MSRVEQILLGLQIIAGRPGADICAEHDVVYIHYDDELTADEENRLTEAGWSKSDVGGWEHSV